MIQNLLKGVDHEKNPEYGKYRISAIMFLLGYICSPSTVRNYLNSPKPPELAKRKYRRKEKVKSGIIGNNKINAKYNNHTWNIDFTEVKVFLKTIYIFFIIEYLIKGRGKGIGEI